MEKRIAIIGAGMAGLGVAWRLRELGMVGEVVMFEKSRGFGGRVASRTREGVRVDVGANFFRLGDGVFGDVVRDVLGGSGVVEIEAPVWVLAGDGSIAPGGRRLEDGGKWVYADGISTVAKQLVAETGVEVRREIRVGRAEREGSGWRLWEAGGQPLGEFDVVVWTAPAPQVVEAMSTVAVDVAWWGGLVGRLGQVEFLPQFSVVLGYRRRLPRPEGFYALVNSDRLHDVGWLSFENEKAGRVADGESVLVVQMSPRWTAENYEMETVQVVRQVAEKVGVILGEGWGAEDWSDVQRWRYAQPVGGVVEREGALVEAEGDGWFLAGDGMAGKARVGVAFENGDGVGARVGDFLRRGGQ